MSTISSLGGVSRSWGGSQSRKAEHEARVSASVDSNGNGRVDATEPASTLGRGGAGADGLEMWGAVDSDGAGSLAQQGFSQGIRDLAPPPSNTLIFARQRGGADGSDGLAALDVDGDGQLSPGEFDAAGSTTVSLSIAAVTVTTVGTAGDEASTAAAVDEVAPLDASWAGAGAEIQRLAGQLKALAQPETATASGEPLDPQIAVLAQKLYDQIARNWLSPPAADAGASLSMAG